MFKLPVRRLALLLLALAPFFGNPAPALATGSASLPDPFSDPVIQGIQARHAVAVLGSKGDETKNLAKDLEKVWKDEPTNYLAQAYLGSTYTLLSRDAFPGPSKYTYLRDGIKNMDAAVASAPGNPGVRLVRAIDYIHLPAIFGYRQIARDDFLLLMRQVMGQEKTNYRFDPETAQAIYYYAGVSLQQLSHPEEARTAWQKGLKLSTKSALGQTIQKELDARGK